MIWWDCQATDRVQRWPWSRTERAALAANGVHLQSEDEQLEWLGKAWLRPVLARARALHLHPARRRRAPSPDLGPDRQPHRGPAHAADRQQSILPPQLGVAQGPLQARTLPPKVRWWQLPASVTLPQRESESFSSLDAYIHSPYQWLLRYAARIRPGSLGQRE